MVETEWCKLGELIAREKLKNLKALFRKWNSETFGHIDKFIKKFEDELAKLKDLGESNIVEEVDIVKKAILLRQSSK